jgi:hypothetical protein
LLAIEFDVEPGISIAQLSGDEMVPGKNDDFSFEVILSINWIMHARAIIAMPIHAVRIKSA